MSFKFDFSDNTIPTESSTFAGEDVVDCAVDATKDADEVIEVCCISKELAVQWEDTPVTSEQLTTFQAIDDSVLEFKSSIQACNALHRDYCTTPVAEALASQTDLVPNIYEGGLQMWECSFDLTRYLSSSQIMFSGIKVLELGCGGGLPGIYALTRGAAVDFQDYNEEVLKAVTIPNVVANVQRHATHWPPNCRFYSGDWSSLMQLLKPATYDIILTSETVYSRKSYDKLHDVMYQLLSERGAVYLAAKTCYFGVGGGSQDFANFVVRRGTFNVETVKQFTEGVQREILKLTKVLNSSSC